jgi:hypothetical protein
MSELGELRVNQGDVLSAAKWNQLIEMLIRMAEGPTLCPPLVRQGGAIVLAQDYQVYVAKTTGTIGARVGTTWGSGDASFLTVSASGDESTMPGMADFTAWSYFGAAITSGIRIEIVWAYYRWVILGGDCSGVA